MKSLKIIQVLAKIMWILSMIAFIACIVGASLCFVGIIVFSATKDVVVDEGQTFTILLADRGVPEPGVYSALITGLIVSGVGIYLGKINEIFFKKEIALGTPFKKEVVSEMRKLAIINIVASIATGILCAIALSIVAAIYRYDSGFHLEFFSTVGYGISLLILSLFCDYGAELEEKKPLDEPAVEPINE
jgi:hypothetical protein